MLLSVIESIWDFILKQTASGLTIDLIFYVGLGFTALMVLFFVVKSFFAYEGRLERSLEKINRWLFTHQQIDETNLVEFNSLIKKAPRLLRYHWQQYMLYREFDPSHYISVYNCVEKPLHTSSYTANIKNFMNICVATMIVTFVLSLISFGNSAFTIATISMPLLTPTIIYVVGIICLFVLRAFQNFSLCSLYQNFHLFNRYLDKASASIPKYVDFEILFTRKEIRGGIPVLNEYLEKRARQEAEELEKARENSIEHEEYDFTNSGIDGSLMLDRAMKESEIFINARQRILSEIQQFESEMDTLRKNYENTSKDYQRKLQASKENVERLRSQQEESTNRIEVNYIRKQQQDEIKKQEQLEKDQEETTHRYNQEISVLTEQITQKRAMLEEKKAYVQKAMLAEYQTFSNKLYQGILEDVGEQHKEEINEISEQKIGAIRDLEQAREINAIKDSVIDDLKQMIKSSSLNISIPTEHIVKENISKPIIEENISQDGEQKVSYNQLTTENVKQEEKDDENESLEGYYDDKGYYWYQNGTYYDDKGYYHDLKGGVYNSEGAFMTEEQYENMLNEEKKNEESSVVQSADSVIKNAEVSTDDIEDDLLTKEETISGSLNDNNMEQQQLEQIAQLEKITNKFAKEEDEKEIEKEETVIEGQQEIAENSIARRGRPRKEVSQEIEETKPAGKRGRPRKEITVEVEEIKSSGKRGRPRKEVSEEVEETKTAGKRGRPRKEITENVEEIKPAGKRGRPRKDVSLNEINTQIEKESDKLAKQQNELNKHLDETLNQINNLNNDIDEDGDKN